MPALQGLGIKRRTMGIRGKILSLWFLSIVTSLVLVAGIFLISLNSYHESLIEDRLVRAFSILSANIETKKVETRSHVLAVSGRGDVVSALNLISNYQDTANYQPLVFDVEKRKVGEELNRVVETDGLHVMAVFDNQSRLVTYHVSEFGGAIRNGIVSFENGQPVYLEDGSDIEPSIMPSFFEKLALPDLPTTPRDYTLETDQGLAIVSVAPVVRQRFNAEPQVLGYVVSAIVIEEKLIGEISRRADAEFSYELQNGIVHGESIAVVTDPKIRVPDMVPGRDGFVLWKTATHERGAAGFVTTSGGRAIVSFAVENKNLDLEIESLRIALFAVLVLGAVVLIPLGVLLVDRIISRPVKTLMDGVQTLQNGDQWALTEFRAGDELGELAQAFGGMAATIAEREGQLKKARESLEEKVVQRTAELRHEIVVRAKAEEDLREALDLNEKITDKSPFGIIVFDENGVMVTVNEAAANIAGATINDLVGLRFYDLSSWRESGLASFADRALKSGMPQRADNVHAITKFGREVYLDAHFVPFRSGGHNRLLYVVNDVSEIRRAERALRQGEQRFRDFAEAASQWLWETDENHQFTEIIGAGPELLGIGRENILGRARWDIVSASDIARDPEGWRRNQEDMEHHRQFRNFEYTLTSPNGRLMHLNVSGKAVFSDDGEFQGYRGTGHDVTQRREIELQLIQASKMATLGEMATGVAHELNQPLNVIRMAASNVKRKIGKGDVDPTYVADKLDKINHNVGRAAAIIDHMRIFGRREVALEDVDPGSIIDETLGMIGQQLHLAGIEVTTELVENCPTIRMSPIQLEQVMLNLLSNARDALLDRAVTNKRINIAINVCMGEQCDNLACRQFEHPGNAIVITVRDNAGGISDAIKGRIFEPFFTTKETGKGTGLGLSISYGIIRELGGDLRVDNVEEGAVFAVLLPLRPGCDDVEVEGSGQLEHV